MGNESRVKFWKDRWCSEKPLCDTFPTLFALFDAKEAWVVDFWDHCGEGGNYNLFFVRNLNDWELGVMECFLSKLQGHSVKRGQEDRVVWKGDNKGVFFVRGLYSLLVIDETIPFPLKIVWNSWIPSRVSFFSWEAC